MTTNKIPPTCDKPTKYPFMYGEFYSCAKPPGHEGTCEPGGFCPTHGLWFGLNDGKIMCPNNLTPWAPGVRRCMAPAFHTEKK